MPKCKASRDSPIWTPDQRIDILRRVRSSKALILADAEAFVEATSVLEYIGQVGAKCTGTGLGSYRGEIIALAKETGRYNDVADEQHIACLFDTIRLARNTAAHTGSWARHLGSRLVELLLILEDALTHGNPMSIPVQIANDSDVSCFTKVKHVMASNAVTAREWNTIGHVRTIMLEHSFSFVPILKAEKWILISDCQLMAYLRRAETNSARTALLSQSVDDAISNSLRYQIANFCCDSDLIRDVARQIKRYPLLVQMEGRPEAIVGIISAYDLL